MPVLLSSDLTEVEEGRGFVCMLLLGAGSVELESFRLMCEAAMQSCAKE